MPGSGDLIGCIAACLLGLTLFACGESPAAAGEMVNVRDFGARGDAVTDDTEAIRAALAASNVVHFPAGVYVLSDGIELPESAIIKGVGAPQLGTFPLDDDKRYLAPGRKARIPGSVLLFRGRGRRRVETSRSDDFAAVRYCVKTHERYPCRMEGIGIVLDVTVADESGRFTTPQADGRADYDVGLLVDDASYGYYRDVTVFGYFRTAGLCVNSRRVGSNPDYNTFWHCSFSGERGVALVGHDRDDPSGPGLSGTQFYGSSLFANDHHNRPSGQWGTAALFIDGTTHARQADINGHYFFGGCIRTYANTAVKLDRASNVSFHGVVFEVPSWDGPNASGADRTGRVVGTSRTRDVSFLGCRMHGIGLTELGKVMTDGSLLVVNDEFRSIAVHSGGRVARLHARGDLDAMLQLSDDASSINAGWTLRTDTSAGGDLVLRYNNRHAATLTTDGRLSAKTVDAGDLSVGEAAPLRVEDGRGVVSRSHHAVVGSDEDGGRLHTLEGGRPGQLLILKHAPGTPPVTIAASGGNLRLKGDFTMDDPGDRLTLILDDGTWNELCRTESAAR